MLAQVLDWLGDALARPGSAAGPVGWPLAEVPDPFALEVHRPVEPDVPQPGLPVLPVYVPREHDAALAEVVTAAAAGTSGIAVLVGGSSTGKTRACWQALELLRGLEPGWRLWHPIDPQASAGRAARCRAADGGVAERGPALPRHRRRHGRAGGRRVAGAAARPGPGPGAGAGHAVAGVLG